MPFEISDAQEGAKDGGDDHPLDEVRPQAKELIFRL